MEHWKAGGQAGRAGAWLAALGGVIALAACMTATSPPAPLPQTAPPPAEASPPPAPEATLPPRPVRKPAPSTLAALSPPTTSTDDPAQVFSHLTGLDQNQTLATLGEPQQRAEAPPAVLWRYTSSACELDLYFYLDLQSQEMRVLHYELRENDGSDRTGQKCYAELVSARRAD
jgi:hypothetical protein